MNLSPAGPDSEPISNHLEERTEGDNLSTRLGPIESVKSNIVPFEMDSIEWEGDTPQGLRIGNTYLEVKATKTLLDQNLEVPPSNLFDLFSRAVQRLQKNNNGQLFTTFEYMLERKLSENIRNRVKTAEEIEYALSSGKQGSKESIRTSKDLYLTSTVLYSNIFNLLGLEGVRKVHKLISKHAATMEEKGDLEEIDVAQEELESNNMGDEVENLASSILGKEYLDPHRRKEDKKKWGNNVHMRLELPGGIILNYIRIGNNGDSQKAAWIPALKAVSDLVQLTELMRSNPRYSEINIFELDDMSARSSSPHLLQSPLNHILGINGLASEQNILILPKSMKTRDENGEFLQVDPGNLFMILTHELVHLVDRSPQNSRASSEALATGFMLDFKIEHPDLKVYQKKPLSIPELDWVFACDMKLVLGELLSEKPEITIDDLLLYNISGSKEMRN